MRFLNHKGWGVVLPMLLVVFALVIHAGVITLDNAFLSRDQGREILVFFALANSVTFSNSAGVTAPNDRRPYHT